MNAETLAQIPCTLEKERVYMYLQMHESRRCDKHVRERGIASSPRVEEWRCLRVAKPDVYGNKTLK